MISLGCGPTCEGAHSDNLGSDEPDKKCRRIHIVYEADDVEDGIRRRKCSHSEDTGGGLVKGGEPTTAVTSTVTVSERDEREELS